MEGKGRERSRQRDKISFGEKIGMSSELDKIKEEMEKIEESRRREKVVQERLKNMYIAEKEKAENWQEKIRAEKEKREKLEKRVEELERALQKVCGKRKVKVDERQEDKVKEGVEDNSSYNSSFDSEETGQKDQEEKREVQRIYVGKIGEKDLQEEVKKRTVLAIRNDRFWKGELFEEWIREYSRAKAWAEAEVRDEEGKVWIIFNTIKEKQETMENYERKWNGILSRREVQPFTIEEVLSRKEREEKERKEKTEKRVEIMKKKGEKFIKRGETIGYEGRWWIWNAKERQFTSVEMEEGEDKRFCSISESV